RPFLQLTADVFSAPWWSLYGGLEVAAGVTVEVFGQDLSDFEFPALIGYKRLLAQASTPPDQAALITGTVRDRATGHPIANAQVFFYGGGYGTVHTDTNGKYTFTLDQIQSFGGALDRKSVV